MIAALLLGAAQAEPLTTSAAHEVRHVPRSPWPIRGPRFAPVTLDVYFSFGHGPSMVGAELARRAVETARAHDVREVLRLAPIGPLSSTPGAELAAEALVEAEQEDRTWPFFDQLLRERATPLVATELLRIGREAGLDGDRLERALDEHTHHDVVEALLRDAQNRGHSAGELVVNGRRSSVWTSDEGLASNVEDGRRRAQALLDAGAPLSRVYDLLAGTPADDAGEAAKKKRVSPDVDGAPARGPSLAPVTIVVYSNLACVGCADVSLAVRKVREAHPGLVREVWHNFVPSYASSGSIDAQAAELGLAAAAQGRFWELHDRVMASRSPSLRRPRAELESLARAAGVDLAEAQRATPGLRATVEKETQEARRLGVPFAPSLVVNGLVLVGMTPWERLERLVRAELERGLLDRLGGM
jgi:protein-disulfide isomerase